MCSKSQIDWWISTELMRALDIINDCIIYELDNESRDLRQEIEFIVELPQTSTTWLDISFGERRVGQHSLVFISSHSSRRREIIGFPVMIGKPSALTKKIFLFSSTGSVLLNCLLPFKMICARFHTSHPGKSYCHVQSTLFFSFTFLICMIFVYPGTIVCQDFLLHYVIIFLLVSLKCHLAFHGGFLRSFSFGESR